MKRKYESAAAETICWSAWYDRFGAELVEFLRRRIVRAIEKNLGEPVLATGERLALSSVKDIVVDSSIVPLHKDLAGEWPNSRTKGRPAAAKAQSADEEIGEYHLYVTNLPIDWIGAAGVAALYRARWIVELVFKELKSSHAMERISSAQPCVTQCIIYVAILTLIASRTVRTLFRKMNPELADRFPDLRFSRVFAAWAWRILQGALAFEHLSYEGFDPIGEAFLMENIAPKGNRPRLLDHCTRYEIRKDRG